MIDASTFATNFNSFWSVETPTTEYFVRRVNTQLVERFAVPVTTPSRSIRASYIAEVAFFLFIEIRGNRLKGKEATDIAVAKARSKLSGYKEFVDQSESPLSDDERAQVGQLFRNIAAFFSGPRSEFVPQPTFLGCGYIDRSEADFLCGSTLIELKTVDRPFRGVDFRQLLIYCALNRMSKERRIESIGVVNPRRGLEIVMPISRVCAEISGRSEIELLEVIIDAISSGEISR